MRPALLLALTLAGCGGGGEPPRPAQRGLETVLQDDALLLHRPARLPRTLAALRALGVDRVRLTAGWSEIAPAPRSARRPRFDAADPAAYPPGAWRNLDRAVGAAEREGLGVMIDVAFFAPRWAVRGPAGGAAAPRELPDPREFGLFAGAVARRYPGVRLWTSWNEPNHPQFLLPQWERGVPVAAHHYRRMHEAAYEAIKGVSKDNRVLMGGTTSIGSPGRGPGDSIRPLRFLRELACVDAGLRALRTPECRGFRPLRADGYAHHPYMHRRPPGEHLPDPDMVGVSDLGRLSGLLAGLHERGRIARRLPLYVTEFGYETDPPDPKRGVAPALQAAYLAQATSIVAARPDVRMHAQFLLRDLPADVLYQTGLTLPDGRPKPALASFPVQMWIAGGVATGQVRPGRGPQAAALERRRADGSFAAIGEPFVTRPDGVFRRRVAGPGVYRLRWDNPRGLPLYSLPVAAP